MFGQKIRTNNDLEGREHPRIMLHLSKIVALIGMQRMFTTFLAYLSTIFFAFRKMIHNVCASTVCLFSVVCILYPD